MKGSLTVEAAYVFPMSLFFIGILCLLGIYQYNQAVLKMTGYECILQTMEERIWEEHIFEEILLGRARQAGGDRTFGVDNLSIDIKMTATQIVLNYEGTQSMLNVPVKVQVVYRRIHPELTLRAGKAIGGG